MELAKKFTDELVQALRNGDYADDGEGKEDKEQVGNFMSLALQYWIPEAGANHVIWNQWCVGHLTDEQLAVYLQRCKDGAKQATEGQETYQSWIVGNENLLRTLSSRISNTTKALSLRDPTLTLSGCSKRPG